VDLERALREPALAVLSALAHGEQPGGADVVRAALLGLDGMPGDHAIVFLDLIRASLDTVVRRILEADMDFANYEFKSDYFREKISKAREEGREEGRVGELRRIALRIAQTRIGEIAPQVQARLDACDDAERLESLVLALSAAGDPVAIEKLLFDF
jgi:hypothetical protein